MSSRLAWVSLAALVSVFGASGCVDNDISLTIDKFIAQNAMDCTIDPATELIKGGGTYDARVGRAYGVGYSVAFVVTNNLPSRETIPVETQAYFIQGYDVELVIDDTSPAAALIPPSKRSFFSQESSVRLVPGGSAGAGVYVLKSGQLDALADDPSDEESLITIRVRPVATRAEERVEGAFSSFPLTVCSHCLSGPRTLPACPIPGMVPDTLKGNACNPAADKFVSCCGSGTALVCGEAAYDGMTPTAP